MILTICLLYIDFMADTSLYYNLYCTVHIDNYIKCFFKQTNMAPSLPHYIKPGSCEAATIREFSFLSTTEKAFLSKILKRFQQLAKTQNVSRSESSRIYIYNAKCNGNAKSSMNHSALLMLISPRYISDPSSQMKPICLCLVPCHMSPIPF